jgi:hypothetical protein
MEETKNILMFAPTKGECPIELFTQWELELKALEDWLGNPEPKGGCQEIPMLEEIEQHKSPLEEAGMGTFEGLAGENLSKEVVGEKKFSDEEPAGVKTTEVWQAKAAKEEYILEIQCYFTFNMERVLRASL